MEQPIDRTEGKKQEATELTEEILALKEQTEQAARTIHENKKKATHIERSNTWKAAAFLGRIKTVFMRMLGLETHHEQQKQIAQLEKRVKESEQELFEAKETVRKLELQDTELNRNEVYQFMRDLKNEGELTSFIDHFIEEKSKQQANYKEALTYAARLYMNDEEAYRNVMYANILSGLTIEEIPEFMIRAGLSSQPIPLRRAASFRGSLNMRMRQKQLQDALPEWELDDKRRAYAFAEKLGVPIPEIDENHY